FHGSTLVKTADGYKAIAHIQAGDRVLSKDEASGETGYKPVTARYGNPYQETVYIEVSDGIGNSQTLISNRIHPFYSGGKWIKAEDLKAGIRLLSESGRTQTVRNIVVKPKPLKAYNLTVADWHTYFVKGNQAETEGVWVHNACPPYKRPNNATTKAQRESVQGKPCVECGKLAEKMIADHKKPLVVEYYETGTIDKSKMRAIESVQPQCPTCSAKQGGRLSRYSKEQKRKLSNGNKK
ncbi:TPA: polymorphic toxin MafB class 1, partial [Neisseria gonorrhoeae]